MVAFGTGLRLSRHVRAGFTVNRWLNGYEQTLSRTILKDNQHPLREFGLDFRPSGWSFNLGLIVSPLEQLNVAAVYKTPFTADVSLDKSRRDSWGTISGIEEVTTNAASSEAVRLDFPSSYGFGLSWRPRDALTLSADFTRTHWSEARILNYFELAATQRERRRGPGGAPAAGRLPGPAVPHPASRPRPEQPRRPVEGCRASRTRSSSASASSGCSSGAGSRSRCAPGTSTTARSRPSSAATRPASTGSPPAPA